MDGGEKPDITRGETPNPAPDYGRMKATTHMRSEGDAGSGVDLADRVLSEERAADGNIRLGSQSEAILLTRGDNSMYCVPGKGNLPYTALFGDKP